MCIDFLFEVFRQNAESEAVIWRNQSFAYGKLLDWTNHWRSFLRKNRIATGTVTAIEADFSPNAIALMLALIESGCIAVPLTSSVAARKAEFMAIAGVEALLELDARDEARLTRFERPPTHKILQRLREREHPGLILFSSGSTGESKAAVHDIVGMLGKFKVRRHARRAITFLLYDHIGGFNTMLYQLSNAGCIVTVQDRDPDTVLRAVEQYKVELLPTSPTFINLILLSEAYRRYDLSSLKIVTYGTEPMPESTLRRFHQVLPHIELQQTYGLSEVGILRSKSRSSDSLWVKLGGEGFQTRVVDEILQTTAGLIPVTRSKWTATISESSGASLRSSTSAARKFTRRKSKASCMKCQKSQRYQSMATKMPSRDRSYAPRFDFGSRATRGSSIASSGSFAGSGSRSFRFPSESGWWKMRCTENASKRIGEKTWPADEVQARHPCECPRADGTRENSIHRRLFHELFPPGNGGTTDSHRRDGSERLAGQ